MMRFLAYLAVSCIALTAGAADNCQKNGGLRRVRGRGDGNETSSCFLSEQPWTTGDQDVGGYDLVVDVDRLQDLANPEKGWPVKVSGKETLTKLHSHSKHLKVAVIGNYGRGKTWLLSKLARQSLPRDRTLGLRVLHSDRIAFIDAPGEGRPPATREQVEDRPPTDMFLRNMALGMAEVIIVVTNKLTPQDKALVSTVEEKVAAAAERGQRKLLVVVHNFKTIWSARSIEELIRLDIPTAHEEHIPYRGRYLPYWKSKASNVMHVVLAREGSDAGGRFNAGTFSILDQSITSLILSLPEDRLRESVLQRFHSESIALLPGFFQGLNKSDFGSRYTLALTPGEKGRYKFALGPSFHAEIKPDFGHIEDDECNLRYSKIGNEESISVKIVIPTEFSNASLPEPLTRRSRFKHWYTWAGNADGLRLEVNVTLMGISGPRVDVLAAMPGNRQCTLPIRFANAEPPLADSFYDCSVQLNSSTLELELHTRDDELDEEL